MKFLKLSLIIFFLFFNVSINAQSKFDKVNIKTTKLSDHIYMLEGSGGNIGVSVGNDGVFIIDTQFAPLTPKILTAIKKLSDQPLKLLQTLTIMAIIQVETKTSGTQEQLLLHTKMLENVF